MPNFTTSQLSKFIHSAAATTYAGGGSYEKNPERPGFLELVFEEGDWNYRDSYTGFYRSSGSEVVRYKNHIVWVSNYCGGMVTGQEKLAGDTFAFLKQAMLAKPEWSFRGPDLFEVGKWRYANFQKGNIVSFSSHEEIYYQNQIVFSHDVMGIMIKHQDYASK
jgi:hypothetical protein